MPLFLARDLGKPLRFGKPLRLAHLGELLLLDAATLGLLCSPEARMAGQISRADPMPVSACGVPGVARQLRQGVMHLGKLLDAMRLADPRRDIGCGRGRLDHAVLMQDLDGGVVHDGSGQLERHEQGAPCDEVRDLGEPLEVGALVLARGVPQMVERCPVLAAEDVVERRAQADRTLLDERVLLADHLADLALEHHAEVVDIDHDARNPR